MYKYLTDPFTGANRTDFILRTSDSAIIPINTLNRDWIKYQAWLDLGNTPEAA